MVVKETLWPEKSKEKKCADPEDRVSHLIFTSLYAGSQDPQEHSVRAQITDITTTLSVPNYHWD